MSIDKIIFLWDQLRVGRASAVGDIQNIVKNDSNQLTQPVPISSRNQRVKTL